MDDNLLKNLNTEQKRAVTTINGPILILAGAGSGKTRVITYRIAYLISRGINPVNILAVTFTNKAADEMKNRVAKLLAEKSLNLWIGTFHSICVRILRREIHNLGFDRNFSIYDEQDKTYLVKEIIKNLNFDDKLINPKAVANKISSVKNELIDPEEFSESYTNSFFDEVVADVYKEYQKRLKKNNALDFDDLIGLVIELLQRFPKIREKYQDIFQYILVDEYQDTNHAQYLLVKLLDNINKNICVVGDPDQSIYNFRGADIRNILNFENDYPETKIFKLEENYRSTKNILAGAQSVIENNSQRKRKGLWTNNKEGELIKIYQAFNEKDEGEYIISEVRKIIRNERSVGLNDLVVFYRTHAQSRALEESFVNSSIPYRIVGGVSFYERKEVKDILAYLKMINNSTDTVSLKRIINVPPRGIGDATFKHIIDLNGLDGLDQKFLDGIEGRAKKYLESFYKVYKKIKESSKELVVSDLTKLVIQTVGYKDFLLDGTSEGEARWENVRELLSVTKRFDNLPSFPTLSDNSTNIGPSGDSNLINKTTIRSMGKKTRIMIIAKTMSVVRLMTSYFTA